MKRKRSISAERRSAEQETKRATLKILNKDSDLDFGATTENGDSIIHALCQHFTIKEINEILNNASKKNFNKFFKDPELEISYDMFLRNAVYALRKGKAPDNIEEHEKDGDFMTHILIQLEYQKRRNGALQINGIDKNDTTNFFEWLISRGFNFDQKNKNGISALHRAIKYKLHDLVLALVLETNDADYVNGGKETLLHMFLAKSYEQGRYRYESSPTYATKIVKILLDKGVNVDVVNKRGLTVFNMAVNAKEHIDIVCMLFEKFSKFKHECGAALLSEVIMNVSLKSPDYLHILKTLIAEGADVNFENENGLSPAYYAVKKKHLEIVKLLKDNGANLNVRGKSGSNLLHNLAYKTWYYIDKDSSNDSEEAAVFDILVNAGCDVNALGNSDQAPLHIASHSNFITVQQLISHGANVNIQSNGKRETPLHKAAISSDPESVKIMEFLINNGAKVNSKDQDGNGPLHKAAYSHNDKNKLEMLLKRGALVNARNNKGKTALSMVGFANCAEILIQYGADINDISVIQSPRSYWQWGYGEFVLRHWIKLKIANLPCCEKYQNCDTNVVEEYQKMSKNCLQEIAILKETLIDSRMSLYGWLLMNQDKRYIYSNNENLRNIVDSPDLKVKFPQYSDVILGGDRATIARKPLLEAAKESWMKILKIYLPDICLSSIFSNLNDAELVNIIEMDEDSYDIL